MRLWLALALLAVGVPGMAATRVVSLAPSLSEMVVELGASDLLVGRLDAGEPLPELAHVPSVGGYGQLVASLGLDPVPDAVAGHDLATLQKAVTYVE